MSPELGMLLFEQKYIWKCFNKILRSFSKNTFVALAETITADNAMLLLFHFIETEYGLMAILRYLQCT